ncbi:gliding motility protein GldN [Prevotella sp. E13-27]|uniref:type IX secretion system ring protein PorN/GldN n=1 Tax=Prevotella sp. E13-27 TaxID=2938122 RepID=UPI00200A81F7|nr:gliding motility protein GldN [Prevotella sp. E13-27]MCK8621185.1 gliding motility protein GldN [Prevotella sp. E13-27]
MRRLFLMLMISLIAGTMAAQPKKSRVQQNNKTAVQQAQQSKTAQGGMTQRMRIMYPTAVDMPEDVVWRRDIYREVDLNIGENSGLYHPTEPIGKQMNLFTYVFKLALNGYIPVYEYRLDGNEVLDATAKVDMKTVLDNYHIFYEETDGKLKVDNSDIPSAEVKMYYLKESAYYDQANSSFHIKVLAICPVMIREDDFGGESAKYPLFWVKYSDVEPFLSRQSVMTSDKNNAATMTLDDYFTLNRYKGKIYKTNNMLGKTLAQIAGNDSTKMSAEQKRIEAELEAFRNNIFGDKAKRDSLDSIASIDPKQLKKTKAKARSSTEQKKEKVTKTKTSRAKSSSSSSGSLISVRRQRH